MNINVTEDDGMSIASLSGEVDLSSSPLARKTILACLERGQSLLVDLSAVEYIDSSGIASLVEGFRLAHDKQLQFGLLSVSEAALRVLQLARLDQVFPMYANSDEFAAG